ncbi:MAG TPA: PAS domain-containing protein [Caulobacteraceae bacterium]
MFHFNTELLIDYWQTKKGRAPVLARSAFDPVEVAELLPQIFMAGRTEAGGYRLRLAGQFIIDCHRGARAGDDLLALWRALDRAELRRALDFALRRPAPIVIAAQAQTERGGAMDLEVAVAPLTAGRRPVARLLGLYQPLSGGFGHRFASPLRLCAVTGAGALAPPRLRLAAMDGRRIA